MFKREAAKIAHPIRINMMNEMMPMIMIVVTDVQEFIIYVIYAHAEILSSCNFCIGSDPFGS